ncbi:hypothetical protein EON63_19500 [archaeon]|nr:MAG: hypothetical protein EON63_19500 [archaeon]
MDGNKKLILAIIWQLMRKYTLQVQIVRLFDVGCVYGVNCVWFVVLVYDLYCMMYAAYGGVWCMSNTFTFYIFSVHTF